MLISKRMKKNIIILLISTGLMSSCDKDFLDQVPLNELSDKVFWNTEAEVKAAVTGVYNGWESGDHILYMDCVTDNSYNQFPWEGYTVLGNGQVSPTDAAAAGSRFSYTSIRRANWVLQNLDNAQISPDLIKRYKAEVRFLRAYRYFDLVTLFGGVPLLTGTLAIEESNIPRNTKEEILKFVIDELTAAAADLPAKFSGGDLGRATKGAALGIRARAEAFTGNHAAVKATTSEIMGLGYSLFPDYAGVFATANEWNSEVISAVSYIERTSATGIFAQMLPNSMGGWSSIVPTQSLVDAYETKGGLTTGEAGSGYDPKKPYVNRDPRFYLSIVYPGTTYNGRVYDPLSPTSSDYPASANNTSKTGYSYRKHVQNPAAFSDIWSAGQDIIVQRYAEILLLFAEAKTELNEIDASVYDAIDKVRTRAGMPAVDKAKYNTQAKLRELIRREFRVELAGEGRRHFDIVRWKIAETVMNQPVLGMLSPGTVDPATGVVTFAANAVALKPEDRSFNASKNYLWPIPQSVIDRSKGVLTQNPNY